MTSFLFLGNVVLKVAPIRRNQNLVQGYQFARVQDQAALPRKGCQVIYREPPRQHQFANTEFSFGEVWHIRFWELMQACCVYFVCNVKWHALQHELSSGEDSKLVTPLMLFSSCSLLHLGYAAMCPPIGLSGRAVALVKFPASLAS